MIKVSIIVALASVVLGIISRIVGSSFVVAPHTFLDFAGVCLLLAIALELYPKQQG